MAVAGAAEPEGHESRLFASPISFQSEAARRICPRPRALSRRHVRTQFIEKANASSLEATGIEVRAFAAPIGMEQDPVADSRNASLAQWLIGDGHLPGT